MKMTKEKYMTLQLKQIRDLAKARGLKGISTLKKEELIERMLKADADDETKTISNEENKESSIEKTVKRAKRGPAKKSTEALNAMPEKAETEEEGKIVSKDDTKAPEKAQIEEAVNISGEKQHKETSGAPEQDKAKKTMPQKRGRAGRPRKADALKKKQETLKTSENGKEEKTVLKTETVETSEDKSPEVKTEDKAEENKTGENTIKPRRGRRPKAKSDTENASNKSVKPARYKVMRNQDKNGAPVHKEEKNDAKQEEILPYRRTRVVTADGIIRPKEEIAAKPEEKKSPASVENKMGEEKYTSNNFTATAEKVLSTDSQDVKNAVPQKEEATKENIQPQEGAAESSDPKENQAAPVPSYQEKFKETRPVSGILEVLTDGYGFMRSDNFLPGDDDVYVSPSQIRRFGLKTGDKITGQARPKGINEKFGGLIYVEKINNFPPEESRHRMPFEKMTPTFPDERVRLERADGSIATRIVDMISPIGKGQRGMIVSPPKAGKTTLLKDIARSILRRDPAAHLMILLIDERPEEVTDMKESVHGENVEILYSTFDELPDHHKRVSEMAIERAKRLVEHKQDVFILLDSITRLARAYNVLVPPSGRTLSGGLDPTALYMPKRFFGAARNIREGGSLTILATALVDTGSKMDDVIYEEFKGTGNMEVILDRKLQERRIFPAIDIAKSGTRREDLLLTASELEAVTRMRRSMNGMKSDEAVEAILRTFTLTRSNDQVVNAVLSGRLA